MRTFNQAYDELLALIPPMCNNLECQHCARIREALKDLKESKYV